MRAHVSHYLHQGSGAACQDALLVRYDRSGKVLRRIGVFDGVTCGPAGGGRIAAQLAEDSFRDLNKSLADCARDANAAIRRHIIEAGLNADNPEECFATTAILADFFPENNQVDWLYIGDGLLLFEKQPHAFCLPATRPQQDAGLMQKLYSLRRIGLDLEEKKQRVAEEIRRSRYMANDPATGFSLMNGDPRMIEVMQAGRLSLREIRQVVIATDGMERLRSSPDEDTTRPFVDMVRAGKSLHGIHQFVQTQWGIEHYHDAFITLGPDDAAAVQVRIE